MNAEPASRKSQSSTLESGSDFRAALEDKESIADLRKTVRGWLQIAYSSGLPGKFRAWMYQNGVLHQSMWPLMLYEVPITSGTD